MSSAGFSVFETAIGPCGVAWTERGVTHVQLPEATPAALRARLRRLQPAAVEADPPPAVQATIAGIVALLEGERVDLTDAVLDLDGVPEFDQAVYAIGRTIPAGETLTYGEIASRLGEPGAAQAVGQALGRNPCPIVVPCHRVLAAGGKLGGFSARGGVRTKLQLLAIESDQRSLF